MHRSTKITVGGVSRLHDYLQDLSDQEFYGCVQNLKVDDVSIILNKKFNSQLVNIQVEGYINAVSNECRSITETEHIDDNHSFEIIIAVVFGVIALLSIIFAVVGVTTSYYHKKIKYFI